MPITISEIRTKYPQYSDMSDDDLAGALHKKFYSDMPRAEFDAKIGLSTATPKNSEEAQAVTPKWAKEHPRLYEAAKKTRELVGPSMEMLGSVAGGMLGAAAGTVASPTLVINPVTAGVTGSALGYGIVKNALDVADDLLGVKAGPKNAMEAIDRTVENVGTGALYEVGGRSAVNALTGLVKGGAHVAGKAMDIMQMPKQKAAKVARAAAGDRLLDVQDALRTAPEGLTAAEAIAYQIDPVTKKAVINAPILQRLLKETTSNSVKDAPYFSDIARARDSANRTALAEMSIGNTQADALGFRKDMKRVLNDMTTPMRETALDTVNLQGEKLSKWKTLQAKADQLSKAAMDKTQDVRQFTAASDRAKRLARTQLIERQLPVGLEKYTYLGGDLSKYADSLAEKSATDSLRLGEGARFAQHAADSLKANGIKPLKSAHLINQITRILSDPRSGIPGNAILENAVQTVANDIRKWTNNVGVIDAYALYSISKASVKEVVASMRQGLDQTAQKNLTASVMSKIKPLIDEAIVAAGGTGWRKYLDTHSKGMIEINKAKLAAEAMKLYSNAPQKFLDLVENNSPDTVNEIFGAGTHDIVGAMGKEKGSQLREIGRQLRSADDIATQADEGGKAFNSLMKEHFFKFQLPNTLNPVTTTTNKVLNALTFKIGKRTMEKLTESAKDAKSFNELLSTIPATERVKILKIIKNPETFKYFKELDKVRKVSRRGGGGGAAIGVNSLIDSEEE